MSKNAEPIAHTMGGRVNQKERTRQALLAATRALLADGEAPTIARVAEQALISEATAYRYYSDLPSLLRDALAVRWPQLDGVLSELRAIPAAETRAQHAAEAMARNVLAKEADIRALITLSYAPRPDKAEPSGPLRPSFRVALIEAVLEPLAPRLGAADRRQLQRALSVVIAAEAVLSLKDAGGGSDSEIVATLGWMARRIVVAGGSD
jgi:AcrR family transcriptional regulator